MLFILKFYYSIFAVILLQRFMLLGFKCEFIHETNFAADANFKLTDEILDGQDLSNGGDALFSYKNSLNAKENFDESASDFDLFENLNADDQIYDYLEGSSRSRRDNASLKKRRNDDDDIDGRIISKRNVHKSVLGKLNDEFGHDLDMNGNSGRHGMGVSSGFISRRSMNFDESTDHSLNRVVHHPHSGPIRHTPKFKHDSNWESSSGKVMKHAISSLVDAKSGDPNSCHPASSQPKVAMQSPNNNDKNSQEYEDMLKGKVAERIVAVIHAKVCKSPKLAQFFGNCQGGTPAKDNNWEAECNPLFKPETVKEIMSQMEAINTSETCHKLPPKLYEFLEWLIKVKPARYTAPRKQRSFCDQYTDCAKGDSAFLFHAFDEDLGRPNGPDKSDRYRRNSYLYQEYNDFYSDDDDSEEILLRNERSAQLINSLSQTLTQLNVIEDTASKQAKSAIVNDKGIASSGSKEEERTIYLESIARSERSLLADVVRNQSVGFDVALAENVPMAEEDE